MPLSKKRIPKETELSRALSYIYDDINDIINSVNIQEKELDSTKGKSGDLQVVKESKKQWSAKHKLNFKTDEGWEEVVTSPENAKSFAKAGKQVILGYHPEEGTWEVADIGEALQFQWGSPARVTLSNALSDAQNIAGASTGITIDTPIATGVIVVGVSGGDLNQLKTKAMSGDATISNAGSMTVIGASGNDGLTLPSITAPSPTTNKLYNEGGTLKFNGSEIGGSISALVDITDVEYNTDINSGNYPAVNDTINGLELNGRI